MKPSHAIPSHKIAVTRPLATMGGGGVSDPEGMIGGGAIDVRTIGGAGVEPSLDAAGAADPVRLRT